MSEMFKWMLIVPLVAMTGCQPGMHGLAPGSVVKPANQWSASGTLRDPQNAIDSNASTWAASNGPGAYLDVDLGAPSIFNYVRIAHGRDDEFPPEVSVYVSLDGKDFQRVHKGPGTRRYTNLLLVTPCLARHVRIKAGDDVTHQWSIRDVLIR